MSKSTVFVVGADTAVRDSVKTLVESAGLKAEIFASLHAFLDAVEPGRQGCLVFDAGIGDLSDQEQQARLAAAFTRMPGLLITDRGEVRTAVRALKVGATDVVQKPYRNQNLLDSIKNVLQPSNAARS